MFRSALLGSVRPLQRYVHDESESDEYAPQGRQAGAEERQHDARVRQQAAADADVDEDLQPEQRSDAGADDASLKIRRLGSCAEAEENEQGEEEDHGAGPDEAEFFSHDGKDKIAVLLGKEIAVLDRFEVSVEQTLAVDLSRGDRHHGLDLLVVQRGVLGIVRVQIAQDAVQHVLLQDHRFPGKWIQGSRRL